MLRANLRLTAQHPREERAAGASIHTMNHNEAATPDDRVVRLLGQWHQGDSSAREELLTILYSDLHKLAAGYLRRERPNHTLQPTALIHEAYLKLAGADSLAAENRLHFMRIAARAMRQVLINAAERRRLSLDCRAWQW